MKDQAQMKPIIALLLLTLCGSGLYGQPTNDDAIYNAFGERGREIKQHLDAYDQTKDYKELEWVVSIAQRNPATNRAMTDATLLLQMEVLNRSLAGIDKTFDETKAKVFGNSVMIPLGSPERKKYEEWAAENERLTERVNTNVFLKRIAKHSQHVVAFFLEGFVGSRQFERVGVLTNAIALKVKDPQTRDQLLKGVEEAAKKLPPLPPK